MAIDNGDKYILNEPKWTTTFGQGQPPKGYSYNGVMIPWNTTVTVSDSLEDPIEVHAGEYRVKPEIVEGQDKFELVQKAPEPESTPE
jgi:hypothetical protein